MDELILSIDCGTQSIRAMLFDKRGELVEKEKVRFEPYVSPQEGYAEQDPDLYWDKICLAIRGLKEKREDLFGSIIGVTVTCMRDVGICLDKDKNPLRPAILWMDRRVARCEETMPLKSRFLFRISGMHDAVEKTRKDCKSNWIRENQPEIWKNTDKYVQLSTYLNYKLSGNLIDSVAAMIGHIPFNYRAKRWMNPGHFQMPVFRTREEDKKEADRRFRFDLVEPGSVLGAISPEAAAATGLPTGLPLIASGSDKGCETIGTGAIYEDTASLSFGTTSTIQITTERYVEPIQFLPAYPAVYPDRYNPEVMITRGYWTLTWFIKEFVKRPEDGSICWERHLDPLLDTVPPGSDGLYAEPYWGPSLKRPEARGALIGFTEAHTRLHVYRALIEGINYGLIDGKRRLERKANVTVKKLMVSGGGAQSDPVCQITADMFNLPVMRVQTYETSGLGAAICAFVGLGRFPSYDAAIDAMVHVGEVFEPDPQTAAVYDRLYRKLYVKSYPRLRPLFKIIKQFR